MSIKYKTLTYTYLWKCKKGHQWFARARNVMFHNTWCPECSIYGIKWNMKKIKELAIDRNGKCLSEKFINRKTKLEWECSKGHKWLTFLPYIVQGNWCPTCCNTCSYGELKCKEVIESLLNKKFVKCRPNWLKNPKTGFNLELDLYNDKLKIAIEFQGAQHYKFVKFLHKIKKNFIKLQERDKLKKVLCKKQNIKLICVPYTIKSKEIKKFIEIELSKLNS